MTLGHKQQAVYDALRDLGGEARGARIASRTGYRQSDITGTLSSLISRGLIERVRVGVYRLSSEIGGTKTLATELSIPHKKAVTPVAAPGRELTPPTALPPRHPAAIMLEVIARAPDPRKYAGVVQEIGKVLA